MNSNTRQYNYGIGILRIWMSLEVTLMHFWKGFEPEKLFVPFYFLYRNEIFAVPVFMILAFFFFENIAKNGSTEELKKRIIRIGVPFWLYGAIYVGISLLEEQLGFSQNKLLIKDVLWQLGVGTSKLINPTLYFMFDLLVVSVLAFAVGHIGGKYWKYGWYLFFVIGMSLQFIPQITQIFLGDFEVFVLGRIIEMIPFAGIGLILGGSAVLSYLVDNRSFYCVMAAVIYIFNIVFPVFSPNSGFGYSGIVLTIQGTLLVLTFYLLPTDRLSHGCTKVIRFVADRTLGIYCIHWGVGKILGYENGGETSISSAFLIWVISLIIATIISMIPHKFFRMMS